MERQKDIQMNLNSSVNSRNEARLKFREAGVPCLSVLEVYTSGVRWQLDGASAIRVGDGNLCTGSK